MEGTGTGVARAASDNAFSLDEMASPSDKACLTRKEAHNSNSPDRRPAKRTRYHCDDQPTRLFEKNDSLKKLVAFSLPAAHGRLYDSVTRSKAPGDAHALGDLFFWYNNPSITEDNLSFEMSKIESGVLEKDQTTSEIHWKNTVNEAPAWWSLAGAAVKSSYSGKQMRYLLLLPTTIPDGAPGWLLVYYMREAAAQGIHIRYQDFFDRMQKKIGHSALANRMQRWYGPVGALSDTICANFGWPSVAAVESVKNLNPSQMALNTWWDVTYLPDDDAYKVQQPKQHKAYVDPKLAADVDNPWFLIENQPGRGVSERLKYIADAITFLEIKAEEASISGGVEGMLKWLSKASPSAEHQALGVDLLLEFQRWRLGGPDTVAVSLLTNALICAQTETAKQAILAADYTLDPVLQYAEACLMPQRNQLRQEGDRARAEATRKFALRQKRAAKKARPSAPASDSVASDDEDDGNDVVEGAGEGGVEAGLAEDEAAGGEAAAEEATQGEAIGDTAVEEEAIGEEAPSGEAT